MHVLEPAREKVTIKVDVCPTGFGGILGKRAYALPAPGLQLQHQLPGIVQFTRRPADLAKATGAQDSPLLTDNMTAFFSLSKMR